LDSEKVIKKENHLMRNLLGFLAFAIPVSIAVYFGIKSHNLEQEKYSLDYMPKLKYAGRLFFTELTIASDSSKIQNYHKLDSDSIKGISYPAKIFVKFNITLTNIGKSTAKWKRPIILDVAAKTENFLIRDLLFQDDFLNKLYKHESAERETNLIKEIYSNDTTNLSVPKNIMNVDKNLETTIHILFLYTGENKVLYDTYMWVHLRIEDTLKKAVVNDTQKPNKYLKADVVCCETRPYTQSEKETIYRRLGLND